MDEKLILSNLRMAGMPTFFPHADPKKHRCLITGIKNRGKNAAGADLTDEYTLVWWGKYAQTCALFVEKGRALNLELVPRTHSIDTGRTKENGKKEIYRLTNWHVRAFEFGPDSMKSLIARIGGNIAKAKADGLIDQNATVTAEYLLKVVRPAKYDYNPELAEKTGLYGNARVFIKGRGFIGTGVPSPAGDTTDEIANLKKKVAELEGSKSTAAGAETIADPMADAS